MKLDFSKATPKQSWTAETTAWRMPRDHHPIWALVYDPTPGGRKNDDGTTSFGLRFPALILSDIVSEPEKIATEIAAKLNASDNIEARDALIAELVEDLEHFIGGIDSGAITIMSEQIGGDHRDGVPPHQWHEEWLSYTRALIAKAKGGGDG